MTTQWRPVVGAEGSYDVSPDGYVMSLERAVLRSGKSVKLKQRLLTPWVNSHGYPAVTLRIAGKSVHRPVHLLILEAFVGPRKPGQEALHGDGDRTNCVLTNLRWGTRSENMLDAVAHGTHNHARKTHCKRNHEFTPENTRHYTFPNGTKARFCRACKRLSNKAAA